MSSNLKIKLQKILNNAEDVHLLKDNIKKNKESKYNFRPKTVERKYGDETKINIQNMAVDLAEMITSFHLEKTEEKEQIHLNSNSNNKFLNSEDLSWPNIIKNIKNTFKINQKKALLKKRKFNSTASTQSSDSSSNETINKKVHFTDELIDEELKVKQDITHQTEQFKENSQSTQPNSPVSFVSVPNLVVPMNNFVNLCNYNIMPLNYFHEKPITTAPLNIIPTASFIMPNIQINQPIFNNYNAINNFNNFQTFYNHQPRMAFYQPYYYN